MGWAVYIEMCSGELRIVASEKRSGIKANTNVQFIAWVELDCYCPSLGQFRIQIATPGLDHEIELRYQQDLARLGSQLVLILNHMFTSVDKACVSLNLFPKRLPPPSP